MSLTDTPYLHLRYFLIKLNQTCLTHMCVLRSCGVAGGSVHHYLEYIEHVGTIGDSVSSIWLPGEDKCGG